LVVAHLGVLILRTVNEDLMFFYFLTQVYIVAPLVRRKLGNVDIGLLGLIATRSTSGL
jgi:hypothetical protein